jgi:hypothetical protein
MTEQQPHPLTDEIAKELSTWHLDSLDPYLADDHRSDMRSAADWQSEQVVNAWEDAFQSDLEHGVRWLSDKAAKELAAKYPKNFAFSEVLASMHPQQEDN